MKVPELNSTVNPYLVQSSPPVLSVGRRCIDEGFDFVCRGSTRMRSLIWLDPTGKGLNWKSETVCAILMF